MTRVGVPSVNFAVIARTYSPRRDVARVASSAERVSGGVASLALSSPLNLNTRPAPALSPPSPRDVVIVIVIGDADGRASPSASPRVAAGVSATRALFFADALALAVPFASIVAASSAPSIDDRRD